MSAIQYFSQALKCLIGKEDQRERLKKATRCLLIQMPGNQVPESIQERFSAFHERVTSKKAPGGSINATIAELGESEVENLVDEIYEMYTEVEQQRLR